MAARRAVRASVDNAVEYLPVESREAIAERLGVPPEQVAKLDANENPYGPPPAVIAALASLPDLHLYPDPDQRRARAALADYTGMPAERILLGNGSDELIDLLLLVTIEPGDEVVVPVPSFGVYLSRPPLFGARVITVPRREDFDLDLETIEDAITPAPSCSSSPHRTTRPATWSLHSNSRDYSARESSLFSTKRTTSSQVRRSRPLRASSRIS